MFCVAYISLDYKRNFHLCSMNLMRGMLRCCDMKLSSKYPSLLQRLHLENNVIRQFLQRGDTLLRFYVPLAQILTDRKPLIPYANNDVVKSTENIQLPDISPMHPLVTLWPKYIYNDRSDFPIKVSEHQMQIYSA